MAARRHQRSALRALGQRLLSLLVLAAIVALFVLVLTRGQLGGLGG